MLFQKDFRISEKSHIENLVAYLKDSQYYLKNIHYPSLQEAKKLRDIKNRSKGIDILMKIYPLYEEECRGLMELAESLIRVPDKSTSYNLITDKISNKHWLTYTKNPNILLYSIGLSVAKFILKGYTPRKNNMLQKVSLPFINFFSKSMIKKMASQFILAEDMNKSVKRIRALLLAGHSFSFDMLGETARTQEDADKYFKDYQDCINVIEKNLHLVKDRHVFSVSVKLTSLCPRYEPTQINDYFNEIYNKTLTLCQASKDINIPLFIDAEESDKLEFSFKIFQKLLREDSLKDWKGFGIVVQAYQKRAFKLIDDIYNLAKENNRLIYIRLVKGAYWDTEIKLDQVNSVEGFSLFTRKEHTDISYMACVKKLSFYTDYIFPCFATHNIHTINFVKAIMQDKRYEYQCLFGMGEDVYESINTRARFYCPVGNFKTVLPYLIRRLLENGAKHNFINAIINDGISIEEVIENPIITAVNHGFSAHPLIKLPSEIYMSENRDNSKGLDTADLLVNENLINSINQVDFTINSCSHRIDENNKIKTLAGFFNSSREENYVDNSFYSNKDILSNSVAYQEKPDVLSNTGIVESDVTTLANIVTHSQKTAKLGVMTAPIPDLSQGFQSTVISEVVEEQTNNNYAQIPKYPSAKLASNHSKEIHIKGGNMSDLENKTNNKIKFLDKIYPIINGRNKKTKTTLAIINPTTSEVIGNYYSCSNVEIEEAFNIAKSSYPAWSKTTAEYRASILEKMAIILETDENIAELTALLSYEAGRTVKDGILEIREAVDFLRYYAIRAREDFSGHSMLPSVDGEVNYLKLEGRGVFLCISPWNFPLAIFLGQIAGALAAGNTVVAKPAEDTNMVAYVAIKKFFEAGLPVNTLQFVMGAGKTIGDALVGNPAVAGVAFTGSDITARGINRILANREDCIVPLIAETGGQNCMIVDSTALLDQVARDVVASSFQSAGQRCSSLRVLYLQEEIADEQIRLIKGVAELLKISLPWKIETDVGPIINKKSLDMLINHKEVMKKKARLLFEIPYSESLKGNFFTPCAFEIPNISMLEKEVFGPVLHVIRYKAKDLQKIINEINSTGYGLTFGLHTRIDSKMSDIINQINCGNLYVNRNQIGAIVGSQPFGGRGKSGTGPKAGGPFYLHRFATEKTVTIDITAQGGNRNLLNL